ncbi:MAG: SRPBCC family protein [Bacteroidales bacterium]|jgi:carbon monoxide dehydrogenase subunit G|nr:SRPBCC family protein [Bacteroidales bacterium]
MSQYTSKTGIINLADEKIFSFLSDFTNLKNIIPPDKVSDFSATSDSCQFKVSGLGSAGLRIIEKEPFKTIKIASEKGTPISFTFWIQLKPIDDTNSSTAIRLTLDAELNPMMKMLIGNQLQKGLDAMVDYITTYFNQRQAE